jgi:hypothetical protein
LAELIIISHNDMNLGRNEAAAVVYGKQLLESIEALEWGASYQP